MCELQVILKLFPSIKTRLKNKYLSDGTQIVRSKLLNFLKQIYYITVTLRVPLNMFVNVLLGVIYLPRGLLNLSKIASKQVVNQFYRPLYQIFGPRIGQRASIKRSDTCQREPVRHTVGGPVTVGREYGSNGDYGTREKKKVIW